MKYVKSFVFGLIVFAGVANAAVTSTITAASDYSLRGISQNAKGPVLQASLDLATESGLYLGAFISSVSFDGKNQGTEYFRLERDLYAGWKSASNEDLVFDFGTRFYTYNSNSLNHRELLTSVAYKNLIKSSVYFSPDFSSAGSSSDKGEAYGLALDGRAPLSGDFSLLAHAGYNSGEYWADNAGGAFVDYSFGFGYQMGKMDWTLQYVNTNTTLAKGNRVTADEMNNANRIVLSVTTKLPW